MDGVIVDFIGGIYKEFGCTAVNPGSKQTSWEDLASGLVAEGVSVTNADIYSRLELVGPSFWAKLRWYPWGTRLYSLCCAFGETTFLTQPTSHWSSAAGKIQWIQKHLGHGRDTHYSLTPEKWRLANEHTLLIDDNRETCEKFVARGGHAYCWPGPGVSGSPYVGDLENWTDGGPFTDLARDLDKIVEEFAVGAKGR